MKKSMLVLVVVLVFGALVLAACGGGGSTTESSGLTRNAVPSDYSSVTNPFEGQQAAADAGKELFTANCVACHGEDAKGDGPAGASLDPKPANLHLTVMETTPAYVHWVIAEGGAAAGLSSSMVAYKSVFTDEQIWQLVTYLETLK